MLRTAGAILIGFVCVYIGFHSAEQLTKRVRLLHGFIGVTEQMKREIGGRLTALPDLLRRLKTDRPELAAFFTRIEEEWNREDYLGFSAAWRSALRELELTDEDERLLSETGDALGRYDAETQLQALASTLAELEIRHREAQDMRRQKAKLYRLLGFTGGIMAVILVL